MQQFFMKPVFLTACYTNCCVDFVTFMPPPEKRASVYFDGNDVIVTDPVRTSSEIIVPLW